MVWNLFPFKGDFSFGKSQKLQGSRLGFRGAELPGWFDVSPKNSAWEFMHELTFCCDEAAHHQLPIAAVFWIIWIVSVKECRSIMQNLMQICCSTHSVVLNVTATQYTCSFIGVYHSHWLIQWSHHCSCMHIPVHCPWLPGCMDVTETVLVLAMAALFPDRPRVSVLCVCVCVYEFFHENGFKLDL